MGTHWVLPLSVSQVWFLSYPHHHLSLGYRVSAWHYGCLGTYDSCGLWDVCYGNLSHYLISAVPCNNQKLSMGTLGNMRLWLSVVENIGRLIWTFLYPWVLSLPSGPVYIFSQKNLFFFFYFPAMVLVVEFSAFAFARRAFHHWAVTQAQRTLQNTNRDCPWLGSAWVFQWVVDGLTSVRWKCHLSRMDMDQLQRISGIFLCAGGKKGKY